MKIIITEHQYKLLIEQTINEDFLDWYGENVDNLVDRLGKLMNKMGFEKFLDKYGEFVEKVFGSIPKFFKKLKEKDVDDTINESSDEDKRYELLIDRLVMTFYSNIKYKKEGSYIYVYRGKTLKKQYRNGHKPNTIMSYSPFGDRLTIFRSELELLNVIIPMFKNNIKMIKYFIKLMTKLFTEKFGFTPKYVGIDDRSIMDKIESISDI